MLCLGSLRRGNGDERVSVGNVNLKRKRKKKDSIKRKRYGNSLVCISHACVNSLMLQRSSCACAMLGNIYFE